MNFFLSLGARLIVAAKEGNYDEVETLVGEGANVNTQSTIKWETPLHKAAQYDHIDIARFLLQRGANFAIKDKSGDTPQTSAEKCCNWKIADLLKEAAANEALQSRPLIDPDLLAQDLPSSWVPFATRGHKLIQACKAGDLAAVTALVESGTNVNTPTSRKQETPLIKAAQYGHLQVILYLLDRHAALDRQDSQGVTAEQWALCNNHDDCHRALQDARQRLESASPPPAATNRRAASQDDFAIASSTFTLPPAAAADALNKNTRHSMSSSIGMSAPSPDADWLVAAKRQQRISPRPNKSAVAAAAAAATAGSVDARASALPSSVVGDSVVAAGDTAAADAAAAARREREAAVAAAVAMTAASSTYQRSSFSLPAASVSSSYAESSSDAVTSTASHLDSKVTAVAAASTTAGFVAKPSNFVEAAAAAAAKREQEHAAAAAEAAALLKEQERLAAEEVAAAATAAAADFDAVVQATSDFLGGDSVLCACVAKFCKVTGTRPLDALRALRTVAVAGANSGSTTSLLSPSHAVLSVLLPHCDELFPSSSLAFIMMCHMVPISSPTPATPTAPASSSGSVGIPAAVLQLAVCRHTNTDALPSFPATVAFMSSIGLMTKCSDGSLSVPSQLVSAGLEISTSSSPSSSLSLSSSSTMIMSISSALRETFATSTASASVITRTSYFHQLSYVALNADSASVDSAAAAAAALLPLLQTSMSQLGGVAGAGPQDERLSALAGVTECVGAAYGMMSLSMSLPAPLSSSSPSRYCDLQISTLQSCIGIKEQLLGPLHFDIARTLVSLAVALLHRAAAAAAAADSAADTAYTAADSPAHLDSLGACSLLQRALSIQESPLGVSHVEVAKTLVHLGNAHGNLEEFTKQKQYLERVLVIREANYGTEHALTAAALAGLAVPLHALKEFKKSRDLLTRALRIEEDAELHRGFATISSSSSSSSSSKSRSNSCIVELLSLCARACAACGDVDGAEALLKRAASSVADLGTGSLFSFHVTCGEAYTLIDFHSHPLALISTSSSSSAAAAAASYSQALAVSPSLCAAARMKMNVAIGYCLERCGRWDDSMKSYERAASCSCSGIDIVSTRALSSAAHVGLGWVKLHQQQQQQQQKINDKAYQIAHVHFLTAFNFSSSSSGSSSSSSSSSSSDSPSTVSDTGDLAMKLRLYRGLTISLSDRSNAPKRIQYAERVLELTAAAFGRQHLWSSHVMFAVARDGAGSASSSSSAQLQLFTEAHAVLASSPPPEPCIQTVILAARCALFMELLKPSDSPIESLSCCISALEDCTGSASAADGLFLDSLWSPRDDLCAGLTALYTHAAGSGGAPEDLIELLKKLYSLQAPSSSLNNVISSEAARTVLLLDAAYEAHAKQQQQQQQQQHEQQPQQPEVQERIIMLDLALRFFELQHQQNHQSPSQLLSALVRLHRCHAYLGHFADSVTFIQRAVACHTHMTKEEEQEYNITSLRVMLFNAHMTLGHSEQAKSVMLEAYDTIASSGFDCGGTAEDDAVFVMMFVASERGKEGNIQEQVALLERCLAILERKFGSKSYECVEALDKLADALLQLADVARGKALLLRSLQIKIDRHGKKSPLVAAAMVTIATVLDATKAKEFLMKALAIQEACFGSNSKELVDTLYALGMCCGVLADQQRQQQQQQQQQQSRLEYLSRALSIIDTYALSFGNILPLLLQLAFCFEANGLPAKSIAVAGRGLAKLQDISDKPSLAAAQFQHCLGLCHAGLLDPIKAIAAFTSSLRIQESAAASSGGGDDSSIISSQLHLGNAYCAAGDGSSAVDTLSRCVVRAEGSLGAGHLLSVLARASHARACVVAGTGTAELHMIVLEKCADAATSTTPSGTGAAADSSMFPVTPKSPTGSDDSPKLFMERTLSSSWLSTASSSLRTPLSPPSPQLVAAHVTTILALSLPSVDMTRRKELLDKALAVFEAGLPASHTDIAAAVVHCASVAGEVGDVMRKRDLSLRALAIYEGHLGNDAEQLVPLLLILAAACGSLGDVARRKELLERAVKARESCGGADHPDLAKLLSQLAQAVGEAGDATRKKDLLVRVLSIREKLLGLNHHELASTIVNLGNTFGLLGDVVKKRELLERALDIQQKHYGDEHTEVAAVLVNLGNAYGALGDASKKKELLVKALRIQEEAASRSRIGGKDCSDVTRTMVSTMVNLGNVWGDLGDSALKKEFLERALALQEALLKEKSSPSTFLELATILHNLGAAYGDTGDYWKQRDALERALRIKETQFGSDHFEIAKTLANLGLAYGNLNDTNRQRDLLERALRIKERHYGVSNFEVANTLVNLGGVYGDLKDFNRQRECLSRALEIEEAHYGHDSKEVSMTLIALATCHSDLGDAAPQVQLLQRALIIQETVYGPSHPEVKFTLEDLGHAYATLGDSVKEQECLARADAIAGE